VRGFRPQLSPAESAEVQALLSERERELFLAAEPRDRRHSVDLFLLLRREATAGGRAISRDLEVAALVHDVGKGPLRAWHRVAFVILGALSQRVAHRIEAERGAGWRRALWRLRHHARLGADLLREAGSDERVIAIVATHTSPPPADDAEIATFIAADDRV
jgi:hypothetical protein